MHVHVSGTFFWPPRPCLWREGYIYMYIYSILSQYIFRVSQYSPLNHWLSCWLYPVNHRQQVSLRWDQAIASLLRARSVPALGRWDFPIALGQITRVHGHILLGGLEHFLFFHILGIILPTDYYFSEGLKPPTSIWLFVFNVMMFGTSMMFCHHDHNELVVFSNVCYTCVSWSLCRFFLDL